ncbi:hypothetical protein NFI96_005612 [Prochilodus magdalenae]|nr:hypothetical protein NFI96_005612 [Prochilodus magdalenae]
MASSLSPLHQDLSCPICLEIFTDPVILSCGHSFCRACLQESWTDNPGRECAVCRRRSSREHPPQDVALRNACETYIQQKRDSDSDSQGRCSLHSEKLTLFCVDDEKLVCGQCVSQDHQNHSFCTINKAAGPHKEKIQTLLTGLKMKLPIFQKVKETSDQAAAHIKSQAETTERQIQEEFEKLHQFLREEEEARIADLRKEENEKSQRMKKKIEELDQEMKDISVRIAETEEKLKDDVLVLQDVKMAYERAQYRGPVPELDSGALIDVAKHLGNLRFRVWEKMKTICPYFPVVLDPNTSNSSLSISPDLSSISHSAEKPSNFKDNNPERMSAYAGVLGSEGFSLGTHSWEVEVRDVVATMASSLSPLHQDLLCPICLEIFTDPVILSCGHSYCRACLQKSWTNNPGRECAVCRRRSSRENPSQDVALRNACETYIQQKRDSDSDSQGLWCSLHTEKLTLFCVYDEMLVCGQCVSQYHRNHSFCSIHKAAGPHKVKIQTHLTALKKKLQMFQKVKEISDQEAAHIKSQVHTTATQIQEEFKMLHQFLREEEEARFAELRKEENEKSQRMNKTIEELDKAIKDISARIAETEQKLKDDVLVLQDVQTAYEGAQYRGPVPELGSGALIDVAKHLGNLRFRVWEKMKTICPYFPVVLDPNTANPTLGISANLSSFAHSAENLQLPDNPERISAYKGVLGSEGFSSGAYSWEVEVGNKTLMTKPAIARIRVTLKLEKGLVTFTNPDYDEDLYTFAHTFTKKVYPYFYNRSKNSIKVLPKGVATMASSLSPLHQDLSCPICLEIFTDPVILSCGHSFCRACLQESWTDNPGRECAVCRRRSSREHPPQDVALRNACETYIQQKRDSDSDSQGLRCSLHSEKLTLFCVDDEKLVCGQCVSQDHQNHSFCTINKAAGPHKEKIQTLLTDLKMKLPIFQKVKETSDQAAANIKSQAQNTEKQIQEEFKKLHQFLREEEEARIADLRKEEGEKSQRMKKKTEELDQQMRDIRVRIAESEEKLKDDVLVLQDVKMAYERAHYRGLVPELDSVPVVLDPNTSNSSLSISPDLSSISHSAENLELPDNPERMSAYAGVLGSEGFSLGTHSWEVEVRDAAELQPDSPCLYFQFRFLLDEVVTTMALSLSPLHQDLSCPICLDIFTDPVILSCGHSFCRACLQKSWTDNPRRECAVCRRRLSREHPPQDVALRNACETYIQQRRRSDSDSRGRCSLHSEKLTLFCVYDEMLVCGQCVSQDHENHSFCSVNKAAGPHKLKIENHLTALKMRLEMFQKVKEISDQEAVHIKSQVQTTATQIQEEFKMLHQFLREEEEARFAELRKEENEKSQRMNKTIEELDKAIKEMSARIAETEEKLEDEVLLLQDVQMAYERAQYRGPVPELHLVSPIDEAKHLGNLRFRVWEKMKTICPYFPVVLDPNTANPTLSISANLSSFAHSAENLQLPDNPERISAYKGVLGSEGFSSGTHSWEVEVGDSQSIPNHLMNELPEMDIWFHSPPLWAINCVLGIPRILQD